MPTVTEDCPVRDQITTFLHARHGEHGRRLRIDVQDGQLVLSGCAKSYYQKQLWLHGALHVAGPVDIVDEIEVGH